MDLSPILQELTTLLSPDRKETIRKELAGHINYLIRQDFPQLVQLLYRVDVSEKKLKALLAENKQQDAGTIIADLIIKRQEEKTILRKSFPSASKPSEDERW